MSKKKKKNYNKKKINKKKYQNKSHHKKPKNKITYNKNISKNSNKNKNKNTITTKNKTNINKSNNKKKYNNQKELSSKKTIIDNKNITTSSIKIEDKNKIKIVKENVNLSIKNDIKESKKKSSSKKIILISILSIIIIFLITLFIINKSIKLTFIGNQIETIEVFDKYTDPGFNATLFNTNINNKVKTKSNLDTSKLGVYKITYTIKFLSIKSITRTINVVDTTPPELSLIGSDTINIYLGNEYNDEGINIKDNYDNNLENNLTINNPVDTSKIGTYTITYTVKDNSNNTSSITRTVNVKNRVTINTNNKSCNNLNKIETYICQNNYDVSVGYYNLTNNKTYYYKNNKLYYGASLIKTLDALYLYDKELITDELDTYVKKAITVSDNPAHHYLVEYIGKNNLKQYGISIGAKNTLVGGDNFGSTSVNDQIAYMKKLYEITKDNQNPKLKEYFLNTRKNCLLFEDSPQIMHKYGHWTYVYHNSGIVLDNNPYIVTILTNEGYDDYQTIIKTLSELIYEYHIENN